MAQRKKETEVFTEERKLLLAARKELQQDKHRDSELRPVLEQLSANFEKFLKEMNKVLNISDSQSLALMRMDTELKALLDNAGQGFLTIDAELKVRKQFSSECKRLLGRKIAGQSLVNLLWPNDGDIAEKAAILLRQMLAEGGDVSGAAPPLPTSVEKNGKLIRLEYKKIAMPAEVDEPRIMVILTDLTEQRQSRERLEYLSTHDSLTGLYNRNYIDRWMDERRDDFPLPFSMLMTDMNGLKLVNDVFGHMRGDELLVRSANLLRQIFGDGAVCARWGGDEFLILLPGVGARACAAKVRELNEAFDRTEPDPIKISMAVGTVTITEPDDDYSALFGRAEKEMYKKKLIESRVVRKKLVEDISGTMYAAGIEDEAHIERITAMSAKLAERLGIPRRSPQMHMLMLLARLHDVGKIAIPPEVFQHGDKLSPQQWEVIRTHSEAGYRLAFSLGEPALAEAILAMHERWDGSGYPYGLQKEQIPELSRLMSLVDAFDVMTHDQQHRSSLSKEAAIGEIIENSGSQFDPLVVEVFIRWMEEDPA